MPLPGTHHGGLSPARQIDLFGVDETQAFRTLTGLAGARLDPLPRGFLARHVIDLYRSAGWPLQRAAFEAATRRWLESRSIALEAPDRALGEWRLRGLPWRPHLGGLFPLRASCDCADFRLSSLGLCAHVLAALAHLADEPDAWIAAASAPPLRHALEWDPVRPVLGDDPWWSRLRWRGERGREPAFVGGWRGPGDARRPPEGSPRWLAAARLWAREHPERVAPAVRALLEEASPPDREPLGAGLLETLRRPLYAYQRESVERLLDSGRLLLADDMGLGKTAQAIAACHALHRSGAVRRGLLVVPAPLKSQWRREWLAFSDAPVEVVEGPPPRRRRLYATTREGFLVINYELLLRDGEALEAWAPEMVVLDEAQRIKNAHTQTARAVKRLGGAYRLALTGTPLENRLPELGSILEFVDPGALAPTWRIPVVHGGVGCATHLGSLRSRIAHCFLRRRRAEILDQLPPRTDTVVPVPMTSGQIRRHDALDQRIAILVEIAQKRRLTPEEQIRLISLLTRQRVIANGLAQRDFEERWEGMRDQPATQAALADAQAPKLEALRELLQSLVVDQGRTVIVFSQWRRMLALAWWATREPLAARGLRSVFFTGAESPKQRDRSVVELHDDPATRVLFASDAGGVGLNLQRAATACVNLELPWNPAVREQRIARIHRLGQTEPIDVYDLVSEPSIEGRIAQLCGAKQALFEGLFDSDADHVVLEDTSLVQRLMSLWEPIADPPVDEPAASRAEPPSLVDQLEIRPRPDGGVAIDAPAEVAEDLAALLREVVSKMAS